MNHTTKEPPTGPVDCTLECRTPGELASAILAYGSEEVGLIIKGASKLRNQLLCSIANEAYAMAKKIHQMGPSGAIPSCPFACPVPILSCPFTCPVPPARPEKLLPISEVDLTAFKLGKARGRRCLERIAANHQPEIIAATLRSLPKAKADHIQEFAQQHGVDFGFQIGQTTRSGSSGKKGAKRKQRGGINPTPTANLLSNHQAA